MSERERIATPKYIEGYNRACKEASRRITQLEAKLEEAMRTIDRAVTDTKETEAPEDWEKELRSMLNGMTFPEQIVSHVKALLKAEREKVCGEIEKLVKPASKSYDADNILDQIDDKIAELRED